ncbi:MAG: helix-hairpin-helix domain-containing protein [Acidobacteriia bacterium]|nr:helix-hairpin-helix domain-containing protein [Terriglobia bacterium]
MRYAIAFIAALSCFPAQSQDLPDGPGKAVVEKICADCHGLATIVGLRRTKSGWESTVDDMAARGAKGSDEEFDAVVAYLARYLGKVNVNKAGAKEIQDVADLTAPEAESIVRYRTQNGDFKDLADLHKVPDVDAKRLDERKDRIAFK